MTETQSQDAPAPAPPAAPPAADSQAPPEPEFVTLPVLKQLFEEFRASLQPKAAEARADSTETEGKKAMKKYVLDQVSARLDSLADPGEFLKAANDLVNPVKAPPSTGLPAQTRGSPPNAKPAAKPDWFGGGP